MDAVTREALLLRSTLPQFRRRVEQSRGIIEECLARARSPYVAFSAGKDSSVVLHLVREIAPDVPAVWSDDEWNLPETLALVERTSNCHRIAGRVPHASFFTSWDTPDPALPAGTIWVDAPNRDGIQQFAIRQGYDATFIGLRADENGRRRLHLRTHGLLFFAQNYQIWQCNPIGWWSVEDVWSYILSRGVDYNRAYDVLDAMGLPLDRQRVGPFAVERAIGYGQLAILRRGWPDLYAAFVAKYPEAAAYT